MAAWDSGWVPQVVQPYEYGGEAKTLITEFENGSEQRRQVWTTVRHGFRLQYNAVSLATAEAIRAFFEARKGAYESFTFVNPTNSVSYTVRFKDDTFSYSDIGGGLCKLSVDLIEVV